MGLFSSLFGSNSGSKKAAKVAAANSAQIRSWGNQDIAERANIAAGLQPEMDYADGVDRTTVGNLQDWSLDNNSHAEELYNDYSTIGRPAGLKMAAFADQIGDQEAAAGMGVSDMAQQAAIARASASRSGAGIGNPNAGGGASDRKFQLAEMAARAGAATSGRRTALKEGFGAQADVAKYGASLLNPATGFAGLASNQQVAASGVAGDAVTRGLNVGNFKVGGYAPAAASLNGATNIQTNALTSTNQTGILPMVAGGLTSAWANGAGIFAPKTDKP